MSYVSIDVDLYDLVGGLSGSEADDLVQMLLEAGHIPELDQPPVAPPGSMEDEPTRLAAIIWLRENGWTVEPRDYEA